MADRTARPENAPDSPRLSTSPIGGDMDPAALAALMEGTLCARMGMEVLDIRPDGGTMTMPVAGNTQPAGLLHGGASIALAETVGSFAALLHARATHGPEAQAVGTAVSAVHHRAVRDGIVTASCTALHRGRSTATYQVHVHDADQRLLCSASVSTAILTPR